MQNAGAIAMQIRIPATAVDGLTQAVIGVAPGMINQMYPNSSEQELRAQLALAIQVMATSVGEVASRYHDPLRVAEDLLRRIIDPSLRVLEPDAIAVFYAAVAALHHHCSEGDAEPEEICLTFGDAIPLQHHPDFPVIQEVARVVRDSFLSISN